MKNKKEILWAHIVSTLLNSQTQKYCIAWKLKRDHVFLTPHSKMNVRLAAQVCSKITSVAIQQIVGDIASETCQYLEMANKWFDCMNTRSKYHALRRRNDDLLPYTSVNNKRFDVCYLLWFNCYKQIFNCVCFLFSGCRIHFWGIWKSGNQKSTPFLVFQIKSRKDCSYLARRTLGIK